MTAISSRSTPVSPAEIPSEPVQPHSAPTPPRHARVSLLALLGVLTALGGLGAGRAAAAPPTVAHASLPAIERQVMCVTCKIPLNVAQSPQADRERAFIQGLIDQGDTEAQIKRALVGQYGPTVLGLPSAHGFDLAAYLVPLAVVLALLAALALLLPRWRRHARAQAAGGESRATLDAIDAARLDADLARFD
jgi:cytochrome c-type biogenesis protein CcmH